MSRIKPGESESPRWSTYRLERVADSADVQNPSHLASDYELLEDPQGQEGIHFQRFFREKFSALLERKSPATLQEMENVVRECLTWIEQHPEYDYSHHAITGLVVEDIDPEGKIFPHTDLMRAKQRVLDLH